MQFWPHKPRKSARVIIIRDGKLLVFFRKRYSKRTGEWIEYYSIPGGGIDKGETPEDAAKRELLEEMGVQITLGKLVAHSISRNFEHFVFIGDIASGEPQLVLDSEEAASMHEGNQFIVEWVDIARLTTKNLRYYGQYCELIKQLAIGEVPQKALQIDARHRVY